MYIQHTLHTRSTIETRSSGGSLGQNTIIFIVLGVVCFLVILIGFYLVSRPRATCNATPDVSGLHLQHPPTTPSSRPQCKHDISEHWKIWGIWRHNDSTASPNTADSPTSNLSPSSITITTPPRIIHTRSGSNNCSPIAPRPSQSRRVTSLSVATSFSHSHITEEALSDLRASAYDLDGDLETEMLHSARDDVWQGLPLAVEDGCGDGEEGMKVRGNVTPITEGSAEPEGDVSTRPTIQLEGGDYENLGACQKIACGSDGVEGDVSEEAARQALQRR